jgi:hypothetical protein
MCAPHYQATQQDGGDECDANTEPNAFQDTYRPCDLAICRGNLTINRLHSELVIVPATPWQGSQHEVYAAHVSSEVGVRCACELRVGCTLRM